MYSESDERLMRSILESHNPAEIVSEVNARLITERAKREEFYNLIHENVKAEFIAGEIVFHSPVRTAHWRLSARISNRLGPYVEAHGLGEMGVEKVMITLGRNDFEPDIVFFKKQVADTFQPDQKLFPVPQLVVEILSDSTRERDRGIKFREYALGGVEEYWIVDAERRVLEQYFNLGNSFDLVKAHLGSGQVQCRAVSGFVLDLRQVFTE